MLMKKLTFVTLLVASLLLVGCGTKSTPPTDTSSPTVAVQPTSDDAAPVDADVAPVDGAEEGAQAPVVDAEQTTKLAECLKEKWVVMYGTEWCGHCKNQKALFGDAFAKAAYVDCDAERQVCLDAGVRGFPTWIDAQGNQYPGTQQLAKLAEIGGCEM